MEIGGWIIMALSVSGVTAFFGWSLYLTLTRHPDTEHIHSTLDNPPDVDEE